MKMYEILNLQEFYNLIKDKKMPLKTTYKLSKLAHRIEKEIQFYSTEFQKIIEEYGKKENGAYVFSEDGSSIVIIPGREEECGKAIAELRNLEVDLSGFEFDIEEFDGLDITLNQMNTILPLIKD